MSSTLQLEVERKKRLLCTGVHADVHFLVGQEDAEQELPAHKIVLRLASDVFDAMFRFDENASSEVSNIGHVRIPDVDVEAFKTMLDFIYTDNLSGVNGKNAIDVLYTANKYNLPMLIKACGDIPISELDNVFFAFAKARLLDEKDFAGRCLAYIDRNADTLLKSDEFLQIDEKLLCDLLGRDQLVVKGEIEIWNAALRWADEHCRQNGLDHSPENRRQMLGLAFFKIRFPIIQKNFFEEVASSGMLTNAELAGVLQYHSTKNLPNSSVVSKPYTMSFSIRQRSTKSIGKLKLKIEKFSAEFSKADESKYSKAVVYIGGFQWRICAQIETEYDIKFLGVFIYCNAKNYEFDWSCSCSATFRIVSQKQGKADYALTLDHHTFESKRQRWGWGCPRFVSFLEVMDPKNGWYLEEEDTVILSAEVTLKE